MRFPPRALRIAARLVTLLLAGGAHSGAAARVEWTVPPPGGCVDTRAVEQMIESRLGRKVFASSPDAVLIRARFAPVAGRETVELEVISPSGQHLGERTLSASSCEELGASLPVVIAVLLDLEWESAPNDRRPAAPAAPPEPPKTAPPPPSSSDRANRRVITLAALVEGVVGLEPGVAGGIGLEGSVSVLGPLELAAWADVLLPSSTSGSPSLMLQSWSVGASTCASAALSGNVDVGACAGGGALLLRARGRGFDQMAPDDRWVPEVRLLGRLGYLLLAPLSARLDAGAIVPFERPRYGFNDEMGHRVELYRPSWGWVGRLGLSVIWR